VIGLAVLATPEMSSARGMAVKIDYVTNPDASILGPRGRALQPFEIEKAVHRTRAIVDKLAGFEVNVFEILGMRNLSAFVGEVFAAAMILEHPELLRKNPHQDGYPDLLLMDDTGAAAWATLSRRLREKGPFSPFSAGGFEVKATCGSVPTPEVCLRRGFEKPDIGDQRIRASTGYDWKAHHRETNYLFGIYWDFVDGCPTIVAVFYRSDLVEDDWGRIIQPREGGGRTTSVSIMTRDGVKKMYEGWVTVINSESYTAFFDRRNSGKLMTDALKQLSRTSVRQKKFQLDV
jgi:hypothetical protein